MNIPKLTTICYYECKVKNIKINNETIKKDIEFKIHDDYPNHHNNLVNFGNVQLFRSYCYNIKYSNMEIHLIYLLKCIKMELWDEINIMIKWIFDFWFSDIDFPSLIHFELLQTIVASFLINPKGNKDTFNCVKSEFFNTTMWCLMVNSMGRDGRKDSDIALYSLNGSKNDPYSQYSFTYYNYYDFEPYRSLWIYTIKKIKDTCKNIAYNYKNMTRTYYFYI